MEAHKPTTQAAAWSGQELANPHANPGKPEKVRRMFAAIARSYDLNNRLHSLGRDQAWRKYAVRTAGVQPDQTVLDVACGTGDLTQAFAASPAAHVTGLDFTQEMLDVAEHKRSRLSEKLANKIFYQQADAQQLPYEAASFDVVSIAFGIRNVGDPARALAEFARVLKPAGRLVILEFDRPRLPLLGLFNDFYCGWIMPRTATLISGDRSGAYRYLPKSVGAFWSREQLMEQMGDAGFAPVTAQALTMGICMCYLGVRTGD